MISTIRLLTDHLNRLHKQWLRGRIGRKLYETEARIAIKARNAAKKQWSKGGRA